MEFTNNPRNPNPGRPANGMPPRPLERRVFSDFGARPAGPMRQSGTQPIARPQSVPRPQPIRPQPEPQPSLASRHASTPVQHQYQAPSQGHTAAHQPARPAQPAPSSALKPVELPSVPQGEHGNNINHENKAYKPDHRNTHAGLVGFICFVIFAGLLLSPLLPAIVLDNFPGSSQTASSGEESLACATELTAIETSKSYTLKLGSPIVYKYSLVTTQSGECNNKAQTADIARSSQFNPLGLLANLMLAAAVAVGIAKLWQLCLRRAGSKP